MEGIKYAAIVVVYNKNIQNSITCNCLRKMSSLDIEIVVVDNSEKDMNNEDICHNLGYTYISMNGNKGLSKAYNTAIDAVDADILILLDDDTELHKVYFDKLNKAVNENPDVDVFAPIVYGQDGVIYSPNEFSFIRNHFMKNVHQIVPQERFNAIASCLAIRERVFANYRFDESLFIDQVDQYFFCEQRKLGRKFMKIDVVIKQNFYQRGDVLDADKAWKRMNLRLTDIMKHAELMENPKYLLLGFIKCYALSLDIAMKSRSVMVLVKGWYKSIRLFFQSTYTLYNLD